MSPDRLRIPLALCSIVLLAALPATAAWQAPGDVNGDGVVDTGDVALLRNHVIEGVALDSDQRAAADVAPFLGGFPIPDGVLSVADIVVLARAARGDLVFQVAGDIDSTVTWPAGARVWVSGDINITDTGDLTILQGATVQFAAGARFVVEAGGALDAQGTSGSPVVFESAGSPTRGSWDGIWVEGGAATLVEAEISFAQYGVRIQGSTADVTIQGGRIREFSGAGVNALGGSTLLVEGVAIDNTAGAREGNGINVSGAMSVTVRDCPLIGGAATGIRIVQSSPTIQNNWISDNEDGIEVLQSADPIIDGGNTITANTRGIRIENDRPVPTLASDPSPVIHGNTIHSNTSWNVWARSYKASDFEIPLEHNDWGSDDPIAIKSGISDASNQLRGDESKHPWVRFIPFDFPLGTPAAQTGTYLWKEVTAAPETLTSAGPHAVVGRVRVRSGSALVLDPDTAMTVRVGSTSELIVEGQLSVLGEETKPVTFESGAITPAPGDWEGLLFAPGSTGTVDHAVVRHAERPIDVDGATVAVSNTTVELFQTPTGQNDPAAIRFMNGASGSITGNTIDGNVGAPPVRHPHSDGIALLESTVTALDGNDITGVVDAIYLRGAGTLPLGSFTANALYDNTMNLRLASVPNSAEAGWITLEARGNYWGTPIAGDAEDTIVQAPPPFSERVSIDFSDLLDDRPALGGMPILGTFVKFVFSRVSADRDVFNGAKGEQVTISFDLAADADVTLRICPESSGVCVNGLYEDTQSFAAGSGQTVIWGGESDAGPLLAPDAYQYVLVADDGVADGVNEGTYSPSFAGQTYANPGISLRDKDPDTGLAFVDPETNLAAVWDVTLAHPARLSLQVDAASVVPSRPYPSGASVIRWTGRDENGLPMSGFLAAQVADRYRMKDNTVILRGTPQITGSPPAVEVRANPHWIHRSYGHFVSDFRYRIDQDAVVTVTLLPPGETDPQNGVLLLGASQQADTDYTVPIDLAVLGSFGEGTYGIHIQAEAGGLTGTHRSAVKLWR